jgi:hypothetical protein
MFVKYTMWNKWEKRAAVHTKHNFSSVRKIKFRKIQARPSLNRLYSLYCHSNASWINKSAKCWSYWLMTSFFDHIRIYFATLDHPRLRPCIASFNLTLTSKERKHIWYSILFYFIYSCRNYSCLIHQCVWLRMLLWIINISMISILRSRINLHN